MSTAADPAALRQLGMDALKQGQFDAAVDAFSQLLATAPNNVEALAGLGMAYSQKGQHAQALPLLDQAVELKPTVAALHFNRAVALERAGRKIDAGEAYEHVLRLKPDHAPARQKLTALEQVLQDASLSAAAMVEASLPAAQPDNEDLPSAAMEEDLPAAILPEELPALKPEMVTPPLRVKTAPQSVARTPPRQDAPAPPVRKSSVSGPPLWDGGKPEQAPPPARSQPRSLPRPSAPPPEEILDVLPAGPGSKAVHAPLGVRANTASRNISRDDEEYQAPPPRRPITTLGILGIIFFALLSLGFLSGLTLLSYFGLLSGLAVFGLAVLLAASGFLLWSGAGGIRERRISGFHWLADQMEVGAGTATGLGILQILIGLFMLVALPVMTFMSLDWSSLDDLDHQGSAGPLASGSLKTDPVADAIKDLNATSLEERKMAVHRLAGLPPNERRTEVKAIFQGFLKDSDPWFRETAVRGLTNWTQNHSLLEIVKMLDDSDLQVRRQAVRSLGEMKDGRASEPLAKQLAIKDHRSDAMRALQQIGSAAEPAVWPYLVHADNDVKRAACDVLHDIGTKASLPKLEPLKAHRDVMISTGADHAINTIQFREGGTASTGTPRPGTPNLPGTPKEEPKDALEKAIADLKSGEWFRQRGALESLARLEPKDDKREEVITLLIVAAKEKDGHNHKVAVEALAKWGTAKEIPILIEMLEDKDGGAREAAIAALGKSKDERAAEPLAKLLGDFFVRSKASNALQELGPAAEKATLPYLNDREGWTREVAMDVIKGVATKESVPTLTDVVLALKVDDQKLRQTAMEILGRLKIKDDRAIDAVAKRLTVPNERLTASKTLQAMGPMVEKTVALGLKLPDPAVRAEVCDILKEVGTKASVPALNQTAMNPRDPVASKAKEAMNAIKARDPDKK